MKYYHFTGYQKPSDGYSPRRIDRYFTANSQKELDNLIDKHSWHCEEYGAKEVAKEEYDALLERDRKEREYHAQQRWLRAQSWF